MLLAFVVVRKYYFVQGGILLNLLLLICACSLLATATVTIDATEATRSMREQRPTVANRQELLSLLDKTRSERRVWMSESHPSITEILLKYPRLKDVPDAVCISFIAIFLLIYILI